MPAATGADRRRLRRAPRECALPTPLHLAPAHHRGESVTLPLHRALPPASSARVYHLQMASKSSGPVQGLVQLKAWEVAVKDDSGKTCLYASLLVNFTIHYEMSNGSFTDTTLVAPSEVKAEGSMCGNGTVSPLLFVDLDHGHSWSLNFTKNNATYEGSVITFTYNASDTMLFPDGKRKGQITTTASAVPGFLTSVPLKSKYRCNHPDTIEADNVVHNYWNVTLQAYIDNGTIADNVTVCYADQPTAGPTSPAAPTTSPPKPTPSKPFTGTYSVKKGNETCLLATMGLQLNFSQINLAVNINPNTTNCTGHCDNDTATMHLEDHTTGSIEFVFVIANGHFHLREANITLIGNSSESFSNKNLSYWEATVGSSYMCLKEQTIELVTNVSINTYDVRVQPFHVQNGKFSTAQECSLDDDGILIPIVVGAALAGLIVIIVIAYIIGRRKSYAGYQTL